jgi:hypothetical protein
MLSPWRHIQNSRHYDIKVCRLLYRGKRADVASWMVTLQSIPQRCGCRFPFVSFILCTDSWFCVSFIQELQLLRGRVDFVRPITLIFMRRSYIAIILISIVQYSFWVAYSRFSALEISRHLWNPKVLFEVRNEYLHITYTRFGFKGLNNVNQLIVVMVKCGVVFEVRTEFLNNI